MWPSATSSTTDHIVVTRVYTVQNCAILLSCSVVNIYFHSCAAVHEKTEKVKVAHLTMLINPSDTPGSTTQTDNFSLHQKKL